MTSSSVGEPHRFDHRSRDLGEALAAHAAVAIERVSTTQDLEQALPASDDVAVAKGMLMAREELTGRQAHGRLQDIAHERDLDLRQVAAALAETGQLPG